MQQVELVLLAQRHDVQDADTQGPDVLAFSLFGLNPGNPVAFNLRDFVVTARKDQRHGSWDVIQLRTARACSKSALMSVSIISWSKIIKIKVIYQIFVELENVGTHL